MVWAVPEHDSGRSSPRARQWSEQSPSTVVVWAVPEHDSGLGSPRARQWSRQSPSTAVVWSIIELKICSQKKRTPIVSLFGVFIYLLTLSSPICHVWSKKQTDITYHSAFLLFLTNSRLAPVWRCVSVGPLTLSMKRRVYWRRS